MGSRHWETELSFLPENGLIFLERGERVGQPDRFTGEIKSKKCQSVQAMLQGTGRTPYLHFGLSL